MTTETNLQSTGMPSHEAKKDETHRAQRGWVGGVILILIGGLALLAQFVDFDEQFILPAMSVLFLVWGILTRKTGLIIPGSLLAGVALGAYMVEDGFNSVGEPGQGGLFLVSFAAGWGLITLISFYTNADHRPSLWPLIPGGIMATIGILMLVGGQALKALELLGQGWPVILIAVGLYMIFRRKEIVE